jgi:hypothetical protein
MLNGTAGLWRTPLNAQFHLLELSEPPCTLIANGARKIPRRHMIYVWQALRAPQTVKSSITPKRARQATNRKRNDRTRPGLWPGHFSALFASRRHVLALELRPAQKIADVWRG